jgi:beta-galactosidase
MPKISRRTAIGIFGAPLCSALAQPTSPTRARISLNGDWGALRIPEPWPRTIRENSARYERRVEVPADWTGRRITLSADCINSFAEVFVDGTKAGEMRYPAGEIDLTPLCRPGQTHTIAMQVTAMPLKAVMLSYSDSANAKTIEGTVQRRGIVGDVYLNAMPQGPRIANVRVETSVRRWEIAIEAAIEGGDGPYRLVARVDGKEFSGPAPRFTASWHPERLWDTHTPQNQYDVIVSIVDAAGKVLDIALPVRFGFREFWIDGRYFYLNGTRLYLSSTPLDNAQGDSKTAGYEGTRAAIRHFRSVGVNFMYTHNYGCEPGTHLSFEEVLRACDDEGMLLAFSQPHFGQYDWTAADAEQTNGYAKHAAFYVRVAQNHPSVIFYSTSHNGAGYSEDMNPDLIGGTIEPRDQWSARGAQRARRAESIIRKLDPSRIVYHHSGGNLNAMHTINFYGNWIPPQEMDDWFEQWATTGVKPAFTCEYSVPFLWDWGMYRGWYKGKREFGSAVVPWEFCLAEWDAQVLGDQAYRITEEEKVNLRWEADQFRKGRDGWHRWDYPHSLGDNVFENRMKIVAAQVEQNFRAFRMWGLSANGVPWDIDAYWKKNGEPTAAAQALMRCNMPVLMYIAGDSQAVTGKDHLFRPDQTVAKQLVVINNSREQVSGTCTWTGGSAELNVPPGEQRRMPIRFAAGAPGHYELRAEFAGVKDTFPFDVIPARSSRLLSSADLFVVPRATLNVANYDLSHVSDGQRVIMFEQPAEALERLGFRTTEYGLRQVFARVPDHPILNGITGEHLRDWRGEATLTPPRLKYEPGAQFNGAPTVKWSGIPVTRVWRCGNRGNVASVLIEKPACGDFLSILDGGYGLQYSPLIEYRQGKGMILFCQLDLHSRSQDDPAAQLLLSNILAYVENWKPSPRRTLRYEGEAAGRKYLEAAGVALSERGEILLTSDPSAPQAEYIGEYFEPFPYGSPFAGIAPADMRNRDPRKVPTLPNGQCGGLLRVDGNTVHMQLAPWQFDYSGGKMNQKRTLRNFARMTARLLGNLGVEMRGLGGRLYMDDPEEWDDPYRFFRW